MPFSGRTQSHVILEGTRLVKPLLQPKIRDGTLDGDGFGLKVVSAHFTARGSVGGLRSHPIASSAVSVGVS